ncbi:rhodanese domain-containing protein CG4456 isoform X1 [Halyomorpha halys]|uniref:rhodanese domain-containing protein CG4456 isoform X1 n=3 Tax=Halyomorpha halys TaxID=286706 RepID=UPI0006D4D23F|nr:rhodanese domain-containing protein CG4456-like isoform X2 [Halyomorpha halys]
MSSARLILKTAFNTISKRNNVCSVRHVYSINIFNKRCYNTQRTMLSPPLNLVMFSRMMASIHDIKNIGIEELKKYQENKIATIIDVREVNEIKETGSLPGGINIPLGDVGKALQEDPNVFEGKYSFPKPTLDSPIIFSCRSGKRSLVAAQQAQSLGYHKVLNFAGGWIEWENNLPK